MSRILVITLLAQVVLLASGCAGGGNGSSGGSGSTTPTPTTLNGDGLLMLYTSPRGTAYDRVHKYLFVTVTNLDRVDVFSTADFHLVASIPVPEPLGIDITADDTRVAVGSATQEFFYIDTGLLQVVQKVPVVVRGTGNVAMLQPSYPAMPSNGDTLLLTFGLNQSGIGSLAEWKPTTGQLTYRTDLQVAPMCIVSSADHTKSLIGACGINPTGVIPEVALYDAKSDSFPAYLSGDGRIEALAANPNGTQFAVNVSGSLLLILDGNLNVISQIQSASVGLTASLGSMVYSLDGSRLYLTAEGGPAVATLNTATFQVLSQATLPSPLLNSFLFFPIPPSIDENGVLFAPEDSSIGVMPTAGTSGAATRSWFVNVVPPQGAVETPVAVPVTGVAPQFGFMVQNGGPASGGTQTQIFEYGTQYPFTMTQVSIGGAQATVTGAQNAGNFESDLPINMQGITVQTPAGSPGLEGLTITTPSGTTAVNGAFNYLGGVQVVPVSGAPWQIAYDQARQRLYITNTTNNLVDVYSLASGQFLPPIPVGAAPHGVALTPDGSLLVIANSGDGTVTIVNPDSPTSATAVPVLISGTQGLQPSEVATTNTGQALVMLTVPNLSGFADELVEIDLSTHAVTLGPGRNLYSTPSVLMTTKDGSSVLCTCGSLGLWNSQAAAFTFTSYESQAVRDGAISGDGNILAQGYYILSPQLLISGEVANWGFLPPPFAVSGTSDVLNSSGSLLFQVDDTGKGVQVYDVNHGDLKEWTSLPEQVTASQHILTMDDGGHNLYVLSSSGFTILNFTFVPLSIAYLQPNQGTAGGGTTVTIRGSGFQPDSQVSFGGSSAVTTFVDSQTLTAVTPKMSVGPMQITIKNTDGQIYSLDDSFAAQ